MVLLNINDAFGFPIQIYFHFVFLSRFCVGAISLLAGGHPSAPKKALWGWQLVKLRLNGTIPTQKIPTWAWIEYGYRSFSIGFYDLIPFQLISHACSRG